jgi:hypothetical protein
MLDCCAAVGRQNADTEAETAAFCLSALFRFCRGLPGGMLWLI